jgi:autotransporter-associated beta strand protein
VTSTADIWTRGHASSGILAQSVGGGGGAVGGMSNNLDSLHPLNFFGSVGGTGSGGEVSVTQAANITTLGDSADGIFAQSAGGALDTAGSGGLGRDVAVTLTAGNVLAMGAGSNGIFAQSHGQAGNGQVLINILNPNSVVAGGSGGAAVRIADGSQNTINNYATLTTLDGLRGTTVLGGAGHDTMHNWGSVIGSIDLGGGNNAFVNEASGTFIGGDRVTLGAGNVFENKGTLSLGGIGQLQTTSVSGNFTQSGTPRWVVDIGTDGRSDGLIVSGSAKLGTSVTTVDINEVEMPTGPGSYTLLSAVGGLRGADFRFGTMFGAMPVGLTFGFDNSDTREDLTLSPSSGPFYWTGSVGSSWTSPFVNGVSNWRTSEQGSAIYGTPGAASDVFITSSGTSSMGTEFTINSLTFTGGISHTLADTHTLTIMGGNGPGLSVQGAATLDLNLELGANQTWWNGGSLVVNGPNIGGPGRNLTVDGPGTTLIAAAINTATGSLTKTGAGTLVLRGASLYTGGTFVTGGTLIGDSTSIKGNVRNDTTVVFDQPWSGTYAGMMSGVGTLVKQGAGALNLAGNSQSFAGTTIVGAGQLFVNGILGGKWLDVQPGTMLGGNGVVSSTTIEPGAVLSPGNSGLGRLFVAGDLRLDQGAVYRVKTEAYGLSDLTVASGQLAIDGATLDVQAGGTRRYRPINVYRIFEAAGGVSGTFSGATTNLSYLDPSIQYSGDVVDLTLRRNDVDFRTMGTHGNQTSVAGALNSLVRTATGELATVVNNIYDLPNNQALAAMSSMSGLLYQYSARSALDMSRSFTTAALQRLSFVARGTNGTLRNAGFGVTAPMAQGSALSDGQYGAWASGIAGTTRYRGTDADAAAKAQTVGLVGGFDGALTNRFSLGISAGQGWPGLTVDGTPDRESGTFTHIGVYGRYADSSSRIDAAIGYSHVDHDVSRSMTDGINTVAAIAKNHGNGVAVQLEYGRLFDLTRTWSVEPSAGLQAGAFQQQGFVEGGGNVLALAVPSHTAQSERMLLGSRFAYVPRQGVRMETRGAWAHEFRHLDDVLVHFNGDPSATTFPISPSMDLRNSALLGVGLGVEAGPRLRLFADFGGEIGGASRIWSGTIGLTRSW